MYKTLHFMACSLLAIQLGCHLPLVEHSRDMHQTLDTEKLEVVDLTTFNGAVSIRTHQADNIELTALYVARGETTEQAAANCEMLGHTVDSADGVVTIQATKPMDIWSASISFELVVPENCSLKLATSNGRISVKGTRGSVDATTSNGRIELSEIVGNVDAHTSNGLVSLDRVDGSVKARTSNGRIQWRGNIVGDSNELQTSNGRVSVEIPKDRLVEIDARTSNGSIKCSLPTVKVLEEGKRHLHAIVGTEGLENDPIQGLKVITSNGSVTVDSLSNGPASVGEQTTEWEL